MVASKKLIRKELIQTKQPLYDLHIVIPVSAANKKFANRIDYLKNYGLQNYKNTKFYVTFLIGNEDIKINPQEWPFEVEVIKSKYKHAAPKIYDYFSEYTEERV